MNSNIRLKLLSASQLIEQSEISQEMVPNILSRGLKTRFPNHTADEQATVQSYQDDLRKILSMERISKKSARSTANIENGKIKIIKRIGKWSGIDAHDYLQPHEALFLMEINRLEVFIDSVTVSLERAYQIFLADKSQSESKHKLTLTEYLVYSHFLRVGCNLKKYVQEPVYSVDDSLQQSSTSTSTQPVINAYTWNYLYELLGHRKRVFTPNDMIDNEIYAKVKKSMNNTINMFRGKNSEPISNESEIEIDFNLTTEMTKRPLDSDDEGCSRKMMKLSHTIDDFEQYFGSGSTNDFMASRDLSKFKQIFDKINVIELKMFDMTEKCVSMSLKFSFDLWISTDYQRTKYNGPNFRIIVSDSPKSLPPNDEILRLYNSQVYKAAIIIVCLNEEMSFQAFIYRFTT